MYCATSDRSVTTRGISSVTGTDSWASCGKTSRNQPTPPASMAAAPRMLTNTLVQRPANRRQAPNANTSGHGVDAGTLIVPADLSLVIGTDPVAILVPSASDAINDSQDDHPHHIHEVPIQRQHIHVPGMCRRDFAQQSQDRHKSKGKQADGYVECMQADE